MPHTRLPYFTSLSYNYCHAVPSVHDDPEHIFCCGLIKSENFLNVAGVFYLSSRWQSELKVHVCAVWWSMSQRERNERLIYYTEAPSPTRLLMYCGFSWHWTRMHRERKGRKRCYMLRESEKCSRGKCEIHSASSQHWDCQHWPVWGRWLLDSFRGNYCVLLEEQPYLAADKRCEFRPAHFEGASRKSLSKIKVVYHWMTEE